VTRRGEEEPVAVIIGMDPPKRSATIEAVDEAGAVLAAGRFGTDKAGYAQMLAAGRRFGDRIWAVEGCNGIGRHIAHHLVHDGEVVLDVPPKLSAQVRVFATGNGRKTDPVDASDIMGGCCVTYCCATPFGTSVLSPRQDVVR
jgi:transposase